MYTKEQKEHALKEYVRTPECEKKSVNLIPSMIEYK